MESVLGSCRAADYDAVLQLYAVFHTVGSEKFIRWTFPVTNFSETVFVYERFVLA
jgi:hypothetical protein